MVVKELYKATSIIKEYFNFMRTPAKVGVPKTVSTKKRWINTPVSRIQQVDLNSHVLSPTVS